MPGVPGPKRFHYVFTGYGAFGIGLHRIIDRRDLFPKPMFDRSVPLLQSAQAGAHHLVSRCIGAGRDK